MSKLAKLVTAVTAVKAGDNELTLSDGENIFINIKLVMNMQNMQNMQNMHNMHNMHNM